MNFLSQIPYVLEILLNLLLLFLLLRGPFREYLAFFFYILLTVLTHSMVGVAYYMYGFRSPLYRNLFWIDETSVDLLLFLVVIAFTFAALQDNPLRPKAAKILALIVIVTLALPFAMLHNYQSKVYGYLTTRWFNHASQIWNFGAAIMNLVLWAALLSNRRRDPRLVTLSIGLGIATASAAIVWGARQWLPAEDRWPADLFDAAARIGCLLLWCWVFRPKEPGRPRSATPPNNAARPDALTTPF